MEDKPTSKNDKKNENRRNRRANEGHKPRIREVRGSDDSSSDEERQTKPAKKTSTCKNVGSTNIPQQCSSRTVNTKGNISIEIWDKIIYGWPNMPLTTFKVQC